MQQLSSTLRLSQHVVDSSHRLFMLAVEHNFIQGRRTLNVIAACLYIVCRRERSEHLLIDFADLLQVSLPSRLQTCHRHEILFASNSFSNVIS